MPRRELHPAEIVSYIRSGLMLPKIMRMAASTRIEIEELMGQGITLIHLEDCFFIHRTALRDASDDTLVDFVEYLEHLIVSFSNQHTANAREKLGFDGEISRETIVELALRQLDADELRLHGVEAGDVNALRTFLAAMWHELPDATVYLIIALSKLDVLNRELRYKERRDRSPLQAVS